MLCCPRCQQENTSVARFCARCGLWLEPGPGGGLLGAGQVPHPQPATVPQGMQLIQNAAELYYAWCSASGGRPLLGTEALCIRVFNAGYPLAEVELQLLALDQHGQSVCRVTRELRTWDTGETQELELASYELPRPVQDVRVELVQAAFHTPDV